MVLTFWGFVWRQGLSLSQHTWEVDTAGQIYRNSTWFIWRHVTSQSFKRWSPPKKIPTNCANQLCYVSRIFYIQFYKFDLKTLYSGKKRYNIARSDNDFIGVIMKTFHFYANDNTCAAALTISDDIQPKMRVLTMLRGMTISRTNTTYSI